MPDSGSGTGTQVIPGVCPPGAAWSLDSLPACRAISLARYIKITMIDECGFWGVFYDGQPQSECRTIWIQSERDMVDRYLQEAQDEIEQVINYPLCRRWFTENVRYTCPIQARWGEVVAGGVAALSNIAVGSVINYATEPAVVGPIATTVTDPDEIRVYYPSASSTECIEITPSRIVLSGGSLTLYIPRCRMVDPSVMNNDRAGLDYNDLSNFLAAVDVLRLYNDTSENAEIVYPHGCSGSCSLCGEYTQDGCIYVRDPRLGILDVQPATYSGGAWSTGGPSCCNRSPERTRLYYYAGKHPLTRQEEDAVVRLAHAKMPDEPCGCDDIRRLWARDRHVPDILTRERLNCPVGQSDGSWVAWRFAQQMKLVRGGLL
jgi:hypothetical protein